MKLLIDYNNKQFEFEENINPKYIYVTDSNTHLFKLGTDSKLYLYKIYKTNNNYIEITDYPKIINIEFLENSTDVEQTGDNKIIWESFNDNGIYKLRLNNTTTNLDKLIVSHLIFTLDKFYEFYQMLLNYEISLQCSNDFKISIYNIPKELIIEKNKKIDEEYKVFEITDTGMNIIISNILTNIIMNNRIIFSAESTIGATTSDLTLGNIEFVIRKIK